MNKHIDEFDLQEMAGLVCGMTDEQSDNIINNDEDFDTPLIEKLGVDFEQFSAVAEALLNSGKLNLGFSPLTRKIYLGLQRGSMWVGHKTDITSDFMQVMEHKFKPNTATTIEVDGEKKYRFINLDIGKEILIDGKNPFEKAQTND